MKFNTKKLTALLLIALIFTPLSLLTRVQEAKAFTAEQYYYGVKEYGTDNDALAVMAEDTAKCLAGQILGQSIQQAISSLVNEVFGGILTAVSTADVKLIPKEAGTPLAFGIITLPSWDSVGFCITNSVIKFITQGTINFINEGFDGNPIFIDNVRNFLLDTAYIVTDDFLTRATDAEIYDDYYAGALQEALGDYVNQQYNPNDYFERNHGTRLSDQVSDPEAYARGNSSLGNLNTQRSYMLDNNPVLKLWEAQRQAQRRIDGTTDNAFKEIGEDGLISPIKEDGKITTPSNLVRAAAEHQSIVLPNDRISAADEFDEALNELINILVKTALNQLLVEL